ncbi:hypothetical protein NBRC10513_004200 [Rhodotorula toruloides]
MDGGQTQGSREGVSPSHSRRLRPRKLTIGVLCGPDFQDKLSTWRPGQSSKFHKKKMRMSRGNVPEETHKPGRAATQAPFKTPNIAECARLVHEGKPLEPEYMPDEPVHHPHASSSANSLAHTLLHQYSHRQRAIYGL